MQATVPRDHLPDGAMTSLPVGVPIWLNGQLLGGPGVVSGSGDQDLAAARAALSAIAEEY